MINRIKNNDSIKSSGFTIIEVMIVLAIAGMILLIVFLAIPAVQKSTRNQARKAYALQIFNQLNETNSSLDNKIFGCDDDDAAGVCTAAQSTATKIMQGGFGAASVDDYTIPSVSNISTSYCQHGISNPSKSLIYCWDDRDPVDISHAYKPIVGQIMIDPKHWCGSNTTTGPGNFGDRVLTDPNGAADSGNQSYDFAVVVGIEGGNGYYCVATNTIEH